MIERFFLSVCSLLFLLWGSAVYAQDGEALAKTWCSSCHLFPEPQLLDKTTWADKVLPDMGARLGLKTFRDGTYRPNSKVPDGVYATEPLMEMAVWEQIKSWYESNAPDELALPRWQFRTRLEQFGIEVPEREEHDFPAATAILIDGASNRLLVGDAHETDLKIYGKNLDLLNEIRSGGIISRILPLPSGGYLATAIGGTISPTEDRHGLLVEIATDKVPAINRLVRGLRRPVDMAFGDFNKDEKTDYVIAGFGTHFGKLTLHLSQGDGRLGETVLLDDAGAISVKVVGDDLLVLMTQGDERIIRLENFASDQSITAETIIRFPPSQGSSSMSVLDFNSDGIMDLLYTAGDNADISPVYKPYHGIYLFTGQKDNTFRQELFFHLDGAYGAVAEDFDQDGDMDIAVISYFPNIGQGLDETGFVYLQNNDGDFAPKYIEGIGKLGRFVAISAGDIDGDGDADIALANLAFGPPGPMEISPELQGQWYDGTGMVLLRNQLR
ncbi:MAG: VCBS repeat-containing protein [Rhizobiaceae bacterium]|nr:VCBS repeat-containing protein [Rhizobiaceae bacterium]